MIPIAFDGIGELDTMDKLFAPKTFLPRVVFGEWHGSVESNGGVVGVPCLEIAEADPGDTEFVTELHRRFESNPPKNDGEAQLLALCRRNGWICISEDQQAWVAARDYSIARCYLVTVLVCAAATDLLNGSEAWKLHVKIEKWREANSKDGRRFSVMPYYPEYRKVFMEASNKFRAAWMRADKPPWYDLLAVPALDDALISLIKKPDVD